jgi:hypothetical protein
MSNNPWITTNLLGPLGLVVSNGNLYIANNFTLDAITCPPNGATTIGQLNLATLNNNSTWTQCLLENEQQNFLAADGNFLYCADSNNVYKIDITGPTLVWTNTTIDITYSDNPYGVCVANGFLYVSCKNNLYKISLDGSTVTVWVTGGGNGGWGISSDGINLYVPGFTNSIDVYRLADASLQPSLTGLPSAEYVNCLYANGILYAMDSVTNNITQFNLTAGTNSTFATVLPVGGVGGGGGYGLAIDSNYLYASNYVNNSLSRFPLIANSNICFPAGTPIETDQGIVNIDLLDPRIHTIKGESILHITKTVTLDKYLIAFEKNSVSRNIPTEKTLMTQEHKILFEGQLVPAYRFLNHSKEVKKVKYSGEVLYNVLLAKHTVMNVNGLICETLHPENIIAKLYTKEFDYTERHDIVFQMNNSLEKKDLQGYKSALQRLR